MSAWHVCGGLQTRTSAPAANALVRVWLLASLLATCIPSRNFMGGARTWQLRACRRVHLLRRLHIRSLLAVFLLNFVFFPHGRRPYWRESLAFFPHNLVTCQLSSFSVLSHVSFLFCVVLRSLGFKIPHGRRPYWSPQPPTMTLYEIIARRAAVVSQ